MICRELKYDSSKDWPEIRNWLATRKNPDDKIENLVRDIISAVRAKGDAALVEYTRKFDCPDFDESMIKVGKNEIETAYESLPDTDIDIISQAVENVRSFHSRQKENSWWITKPDGTILGQLVNPVDRVGLYVPGGQGGKTPLISSLIMNAVPAVIAGVKDIAVTSPPMQDGSLNPYILATAKILGLDQIFRAGSAWAIAALACGTKSIEPCDMLAGPGNIFVATAKALLKGEVGIDMIAGPSEILILADDSARPDWLAADMLSQAEHDPLAASLLATNSQELANDVISELEKKTAELPRSDIAAKSLEDWGAVILVKDIDAGLDLVNRIAPEHLELAVADPWPLLGKIRHAGAIFMGHNTPEPVGDYFAGPNHVLPTLGTARFSSALSVQDFCKKSSVISTTGDYINEHGGKIARLARLEGLEAHARSVECRIKSEK